MTNLKEAQQKVCDKYNADYEPLASNEMVAVALDTLGKMPIIGERIVLKEGENVSWFIYCGENSTAEDFYQPIHWYHLKEILPEVLPYLGLPQGFFFIIDNEGYEDIWRDEDDF